MKNSFINLVSKAQYFAYNSTVCLVSKVIAIVGYVEFDMIHDSDFFFKAK